MDEAHAVAFSPAVAPQRRGPIMSVGLRSRVSTPSSRAGAVGCPVGVRPRDSQVPLLQRGPGVGEVFPGSRVVPRHLGSVLIAQSNATVVSLRGLQRETDGETPGV